MKNEIRSSCVLTTKMPPDLFAKLEALAKAWSVNLSAAMRQCIAAAEVDTRPQEHTDANTEA
jgi:predicted transcriptional regulator